jgi:heat shock protein HtpX
MDTVYCFYVCLSAAGLFIPIIILSIATAGLFIAYRSDRGFKPLIGAQLGTTAMISMSLTSMDCYMSAWVWFYLGAVMAGAVAIGMVRAFNRSRIKAESLGRFDALADLEDEFDVDIVVLDAQRVRALAYLGKVYLSVGLLERLDDDQLRAVVAHEAYHLETRPPRMLATLLALSSLTFLRYSDEREADAHAARLAGVDSIVGALETLEIQDRHERTANLHSNA